MFIGLLLFIEYLNKKLFPTISFRALISINFEKVKRSEKYTNQSGFN